MCGDIQFIYGVTGGLDYSGKHKWLLVSLEILVRTPLDRVQLLPEGGPHGPL